MALLIFDRKQWEYANMPYRNTSPKQQLASMDWDLGTEEPNEEWNCSSLPIHERWYRLEYANVGEDKFPEMTPSAYGNFISTVLLESTPEVMKVTKNMAKSTEFEFDKRHIVGKIISQCSV